MAIDSNIVLEKISQKASVLHDRSKSKSWGEHNRERMVVVLSETISDLKEIQQLVRALGESANVLDESSANKQESDLQQTIETLERNIQFERARKRGTNESDWTEKQEELGEHWSALEQKVLASTINLHYWIERTQLQLHSPKNNPLDAKSGAGQLVQLLKTKEDELQHLRERYDKLRADSNVARLEQSSAPDIEQELNEIARKMDTEEKLLERTQVANRRQWENAQQHQLELEKRVMQLQELVPRYMGKSLETITLLKKERDYAKKLVLDIEHEASALRSAYTKELLNLQENKLSAQKEVSERYEKTVQRMQVELSETKGLLKQFREMTEEKEKKLLQLEEENQELRLARKLLEKHEKNKQRFEK